MGTELTGVLSLAFFTTNQSTTPANQNLARGQRARLVIRFQRTIK